MAKLILTDLGTLGSTGAVINANSDLIETAIENTLSRDGTSPNQMLADLDMNGNQILNVPAPVLSTDIARKGELEDLREDFLDAIEGIVLAERDYQGVYGPASATDNAVVLFNGTTGQVLKASTLTANVVKAVSGVFSNATAGTDYVGPTSGTSILKGNGLGETTAATVAVDYLAPSAINTTVQAYNASLLKSAIYWNIGDGVSTITTGNKLGLQIPFSCTITSWTILLKESGSIVIDLWKDSYANAPPLVADTITASAKPTVTTSTKATSSTLTGWTTSVTAGDIIYFNVDSITTSTLATIILNVTRT